ncbi:MAG TPA: alpha-galactosidase [Clostridiaceae bacterium]|nr:alpha-galactosidase [Clostridiaceae bacterium]
MDKEFENNRTEKFSFPIPGGKSTIFVKHDNRVYIQNLFGLTCGLAGNDTGAPRARGLVYLRTDTGIFDSNNLSLVNTAFDGNSISFVWETNDGKLKLESMWNLCTDTGVWSRKDRVINGGDKSVTVFSYMYRFVFSPGCYEIYSQRGIWCNENQGIWQKLHHGSIELSCEGGRTCQGSNPYLCIKNEGSNEGVAFHLLPIGNWVIRTSAHTASGDSLPYAVVEMGQSDKSLRMELTPGNSFELPEILFHQLPGGNIEAAAPDFQRYLLTNKFKDSKKTAPVVYNTWFDDFEFLDVDRLRKQLKIAKSIGCEVFTVDAGWYGAGEGDWFAQAGDWREKQNAAFRGKMAEFAEEVRAEDKGFGLWMEPERFGPQAPVVKEHPEWFIYNGSGFFYPDLEKAEVYDYMFNEISRLVDTYKLAWIKIDFNFELAIDPTDKEFYSYYKSWYNLLDAIRSKYPDLFVEGCASGGMRLDINTLKHNDAHFLSDTVNPIDTLRIYQGAMLRLPGGRLEKWAVLRSAGNGIPDYGTSVSTAPASLVTPGGATWESSVTVDADFSAAVALTCIFGVSGDLSSLPQKDLDCLSRYISFFKEWREFIISSVCHMLTPVRPKEDRSGWVAFQLQDMQKTASLLFAYRLNDVEDRKKFRLRQLEPECTYEIRFENNPGKESLIVSGEQLMNEGIWVDLPKRNSAAVISINRLSKFSK